MGADQKEIGGDELEAVACSAADGTNLLAVVDGGGIWTTQSTPAPRLGIARSGTNVVLSWTIPSADFLLQENSDLTTTNWTDVTNTPTLNLTNLENQVAVPPSTGDRFYRLKNRKLLSSVNGGFWR